MNGRGLLLVLGLIALAALVLVGNDLMNGGGRIAGLESGQVADLATLTIWGSVIAAGALFAFRADPGGMMRNALLWTMAFLVLIGLYAFRAEFAELRDRMIAELVPGRAIAVAGTDGRQFAVVRAGDDHFHVEAQVNGRPLSFLVDTGASTVALDRGTARDLGLDPSGLSFSARVATANGIARAAMIRLDEVTVGGITRRNVPAAVLDSQGDGVGLLGMSFLGTLTAFEFRGDRLVLTD